MRTGPFSNAEVIDRLNSLFIPIYAVNEDYRAKDVVPKEEQAEYLRIASTAKLRQRNSLPAPFTSTSLTPRAKSLVHATLLRRQKRKNSLPFWMK